MKNSNLLNTIQTSQIIRLQRSFNLSKAKQCTYFGEDKLFHALRTGLLRHDAAFAISTVL